MSESPGFAKQLDGMRCLSDFNQLLHTLRTYELAAMPRGADIFLSAGCAGKWYFDWIDETYGRVQRHIGIEYFMPKPEGLPEHVSWVANTVGNMEMVANSSVDTIFSGQNIEHLWPWDVEGFLAESFRTLKRGGLLVIDSPNRLVTQPLGWKHPEHTMEFTPDEIRMLLSMSGFEVTSLRGMWVVRDPLTETLLPLLPETEVRAWPFLRRISAANVHPEHSFLWWAEARKTAAVPDKSAVGQLLADIYRRYWPARLRQFSSNAQVSEDGRVAFSDQAGTYVIYGPYVPLPRGAYVVTFLIRKTGSGRMDGAACTCDVLASGVHTLAVKVVDHSELSAEFSPIQLRFTLADTVFGIEFRVRLDSGCLLEVRTEVGFECDSPYLRMS
jgi:SAM-dependent methyltransferase